MCCATSCSNNSAVEGGGRCRWKVAAQQVGQQGQQGQVGPGQVAAETGGRRAVAGGHLAAEAAVAAQQVGPQQGQVGEVAPETGGRRAVAGAGGHLAAEAAVGAGLPREAAVAVVGGQVAVAAGEGQVVWPLPSLPLLLQVGSPNRGCTTRP
jgi:hypothetical protein